MFVSIITILGSFVSMKMESAVVIAKNEKSAIEAFTLGIFFITLWFCILQIFIYISDQFLDIETLNLLENYSFLIPICTFLIGLLLLIDGWLNRKGRFLIISRLQILHAATTAICSITMGLFYTSANGLIIGAFAAFLITSCIGLILARDDLFSNMRFPSKASLMKTFIMFKNFPKYSNPANLCNVVINQSFYIFAGIVYGDVILGFFYLLNRIISIPSSTISFNLGKVYFKFLADNHPKETYQKSILLVLSLVITSTAISIILYIFCFSYIDKIFGSEWSDSKNYLLYFIIIGAAGFIYNPISFIFPYLGIQKKELIWQFGILLLLTIIYVLAILFKLSVDTFLVLYVGMQTCSYVLRSIYVLFKLKQYKLD